jgi:hypothetical membrane protein
MAAQVRNSGRARAAVRQTSQTLRSFHDVHPRVGPVVAASSVLYFVAQVFVAWIWKDPPYSLWANTISDLGNTACGNYGKPALRVCSTRHDWMNAAFILVGVVMVVSAVLLYQEFNEEPRDGYWDGPQIAKFVGFLFYALGGVGAILVGSFPENVNSAGHITGAGLAIAGGNIGILLLASGFEKEDDLPSRIRRFMVIWGVISLAALLMFVFKRHFGLGPGGMERIAAYPETIWLISFGAWIWKVQPKKRRHEMTPARPGPAGKPV